VAIQSTGRRCGTASSGPPPQRVLAAATIGLAVFTVAGGTPADGSGSGAPAQVARMLPISVNVGVRCEDLACGR
jgi:hypothetical protein